MESLQSVFRMILSVISPKLNTKVVYRVKFKKNINLNNPTTLDEKIQWLKFNTYKNNKLVRDCVDKYKVRDYVAKCGCSEILNEMYFSCDHPSEITSNMLPKRFVLKWNFGCGQNLICYDYSKLDFSSIINSMKKWYRLRNTFFLEYSEIQYKGIKPKIICERLIESGIDNTPPIDYKIYCFNGIPHCVMACFNRSHGKANYYFFDKDFNFLRNYNKSGKEAPADIQFEKPIGYEKLFYYAELLSKPFPFVRVDLYIEDGNIIFGELTFTPCGGFDTNRLPEMQLLFGSMLKLPKDEQ